MKYLFIYSILILTNALFAQARQITDFFELMGELKSGNEVRIVIDYGKCSLMIDGEETEAPKAIGGMNMNTFEFFDVGVVRNELAYVTSSETVLIGHPFYGYVYNYAKVRIYSDNSVEIIARYLEPNTYDIKMDETFKSVINNLENDGAVSLFVKD